VVVALLLLGVHALRREVVPAMPEGFCERDGAPVIPTHVTIAAVFATIDGPDDVARWSMETLGNELRKRGFREVSMKRFERDDATIEVVGPLPDDADAVTEALDRALAGHDVVYYNGHNFAGELEIDARAGRRIVVLDTCWSAQHYGAWSREVALIANSERAITGSVYSFVDLLDGLLARDGRSWRALLAPANVAATDRASLRIDTKYPEPERYGLIGACQGQAPAVEP
jgi:hypothetical protein